MEYKIVQLSRGLKERDLIIYGLWTVSDLTQIEIGKIYNISHQRVSQIIEQQSQSVATLRKKDYQIICHILDGLYLMITEQGRFICWQPSDCDRAAHGMWREHTEGRLREKISERLATKGNTNV